MNVRPGNRTSSSLQIEPCDPAFLDTAASFLQTGWWAAFKGRHGWKPLAFRIRAHLHEGQAGGQPLSVLVRPLALGFHLAYVPHAVVPGPGLEDLSKALAPFLPPGTLCLRWDLLGGTRAAAGAIPADEAEDGAVPSDPLPAPLPPPFRKPPADVQPPDTVVVTLGGDETMLARMHKKTRYNAKLAEKKGVTVEKAGVEALADWYALYRQTAQRDKISIHSEKYYRDLFSHAPDLTLWLARFEEKLLAGNIVLIHGATATYLYGASSNEHRNLMAPYALQWAALRDARDKGCAEYDLFGIPPSDDPDHPMHGLYRFKTGFGGDRLHRPGAWDYVLSPLAYRAWTQADAARIWYHKVWKKR